MNKAGPIINPDIYNYNSLSSNIEQACDKNEELDDKLIINIIIKYFFAYYFPESSSDKVSLTSIEAIFNLANSYYELLEKHKNTSIQINDPYIEDLIKFTQENGYPLAMLGDIAPTTVIVKAIANTILEPRHSDFKYTGLDLGSGTGILLLAQYIQARRNGFYDIKNIGIELSKEAVTNSNKLIQSLAAGEVINGDTTKQETLKGAVGDRIITHISNETIPTNGISMTGENDPFHQNNYALYKGLASNITEATRVFPERVNIILDILGTSREIEANHKNSYGLKLLLEFEKIIKNTPGITFPDNWRIFNETKTDSISIDGNMVPQNTIGKHLEDKGFVYPLEHWKKRWH